ncbi:hypothetical protein BB560_004362 [Smittium megazygosporum]|uniref:AMP-dependent synthetase/ligase domain-containing protein n=1 Tax=Smittium megazygosporum TaxID=133381 RepID=A0A2T9Z9E6_9FUNG|nr:hypothetical protein BB560_004362 [Smittium megazygosporum]
MIFKSQLPPVDISDLDLVSFCLSEAKREFARSTNKNTFALREDTSGISFTIFDIEKYSKQFASGLIHNLGFKDNDVLALFTPNTVYFPIVVFGTLMSSGICTLANPTYTPRELAHQLRDSGSKAIATQSYLLPTVKKALELAGLNFSDSQIILLDNAPPAASAHPHINNFYSPAPFNIFKINCPNMSKDRVAILFYSSGTTGVSKGVMLTHKNLVTSITINSNFFFLDGYLDESVHPRCFLAVLPHYHVYGFVINLLMGICTATGNIIVPKYETTNFMYLVQKYRVTFCHVVPPIIVSILNFQNSADYDISSCKFFMTGAAPLGKDVLAKFSKTYPNIYVVQAYGMTETSPTVTNAFKTHPHDGSSGVLLSNMDSKVVDEDGNPLGFNQVGEICMRGPNVMKGYLNNPEATANSIDSEGFMHTGDIGYVGTNYNYYIVDRKKELIKYKGYQVPPAELESLLYLHEDVADSAVIGIYLEDQATEVPKAFIALSHKNSNLSPSQVDEKVAQILEWINSQVAPHKKLRGGIQVLDSIPKTASGKILRKDLRAMEKAQSDIKKAKNKL